MPVLRAESKETIIIRNSNEIKENIFNDVLKNISVANKLLQDLIKNYEHVQNIYKSSEGHPKSSESDIETFKANEASNSNEINTEATIDGLDGRTQMIFDETVESTEDTSVSRQTNGSDIIVIQSVEGKDINFNISESLANVYKKTSSDESDEIEIITKKFNYSIIEKKVGNDNRKGKSKSPKRKHPDKNVKTRYSIQKEHLRKDVKRNFNKVTRPNLRTKNERDRKVKRIVYAEIFSPDRLWHEVVHKPLNLKVYKDEHDKIVDEDNSSDSKPENEIIEKEQLKGYLLRNAYGDACLQVAVRKCYKALKAVCKTVCRMQSKCKSSLKGSFKENSKRGCIQEFTNSKNKSGDEINADDLDRRSFGDDITPRYIELCLPAMRIGSQANNKKGHLQNDTNDYKVINVLRDRFEKACKKLSAKKCMKACKYATNAACSTNACGTKKKAFTKACKRECKQAYNLFKESSDSDDDDDDSDSD